MYNDKHFKTVEIILSSGGLNTYKREFSDCQLTVNENFLIISNYEKVEKAGDPNQRVHQVFKMSEVVKFKTIEHNITNIKTTKNDS